MKSIDEQIEILNKEYDIKKSASGEGYGELDHESGILYGLELSKTLSPCSLNLEDLTKRMQAGIVQIEFAKAGGEVRKAFGTLNEKFLPVRKESEPGKPAATIAKSPNNFVYFDMEKQAWRSFNISSLIKIF